MRSCTSASDSERCRSVPIVYSPSRRLRRWVAKCSRSQIASSISAARSASISPGMLHESLAAPLAHRDAAHAVADERREVRMREAVAQDQLGAEAVGVLAVTRRERHDDVRVALLRADERRGVGLAAIELGQHLVGRVAAPGAVPLHLPPAPQLLGRREEDAHVVAVAHRLRVVAEQALDDREAAGPDVDGRREGAVRVPVDRLQDGLAVAQMAQVLRHDVEVVGVGVQRRDAELGSLPAVVAVVVVGAGVGHGVLAQHAHEAPGHRGLAGRRVADDAEDDRTRHRQPRKMLLA